MSTNNTVHPFQKVFVNFSLILLGISANTAFFSFMVTLLLGSVFLGYLNSKQEKFALKTKTLNKEKKLEKLPIS